MSSNKFERERREDVLEELKVLLHGEREGIFLSYQECDTTEILRFIKELKFQRFLEEQTRILSLRIRKEFGNVWDFVDADNIDLRLDTEGDFYSIFTKNI